MLQPIPERKRIFEQKLEERYEADFSALRLWKSHRETFFYRRGSDNDKRVLQFLTTCGTFISGWRNKLCIDLGCGSGSVLVALKALGAKGIGLELEHSGADLELAKVRASMYGMTLELVNADATKALFKASVFDIALSTSVVEHVPNVVDYVSEAYRVLKPGVCSLLLLIIVFH